MSALMEHDPRDEADSCRRALDAVPQVVVVVGRDGRIVWANSAAKRLLGGDLAGRHTFDLVDERERERVADLRERVFSGERAVGEMIRVLNPAGEEAWIEWVGSILDGHAVYFGRDVTEERRDRELVAAEQWILRAVLRGRPFHETAREACELLQRLIADCGCSVKAVAPDGARLHLIASAGLPEGAPIPGEDGARDTRLALLREWAIGASPRSHWAGPLIDDAGVVVGVLSLHFGGDRKPRDWETAVARRLTTVLTLAAVTERTRLSERERPPTNARQAL